MASTTAAFLSTLARATASLSSSTMPSGGAKVIRFLPAQTSRGRRAVLSAPRAAASGTEKAAASDKGGKSKDERVVKVHSIEEFDGALQAAKNRLVVVEFAASDSEGSSQMYPTMVQLSRTCGDVDFLLVMGDESEVTKELCHREGVT